MRRGAGFLGLLLGLLPRLLLACPGCNVALGQSQNMGLAKGFYYSIFFMLAMIFGLVGVLIARIMKEARESEETAALKPPL